jgi:hypothetical protein
VKSGGIPLPLSARYAKKRTLVKSLAAKIIFRLLLLALMGAGAWLWFALSPVRHPPGVLIQSGPTQIEGPPIPLPTLKVNKEYELSRLAGFRIQGRVLSVQRYHDPHASLIPFDVVLGWGAMSDTETLTGATIKQALRHYSLRWKDEPTIKTEDALLQSANLHLIPGNGEVATFFGRLKPGCVVEFRGSLVEARKGDFVWKSSLSRGDNGPGSGELMLVTQARGLFDGSQNLSTEETREQAAEFQSDLKRWFENLQERRKTLDLNDPVAVREFNLEAERYMMAAHPSPSPSKQPSK